MDLVGKAGDPCPPDRRWNWKWGYGPQPDLLIKPRDWETHHLIGKFHENDLRRAVWGYAFLAVLVGSPVLLGLCGGLVVGFWPGLNQWVDLVVALMIAVAAILGVIGYALVGFNTQPPAKIAPRLPLEEPT